MEQFQLITDSSCDLPKEFLEQEGILSMPLSVHMNGQQYYSDEICSTDFYKQMRAGAMPTTSQVNAFEATAIFEKVLQQGRDILYIGFSSGMSGTLNSARVAAEELTEKYPERKIAIVDSLCVTLGQGLLVHLTNDLRKAGETLEKASQWARDQVSHLAIFVTTSNLVHLHHGGRISKAASKIGSLLGVQPIIAIDEHGKPKVISGKRGNKNALNSLVEHMAKVIGDTVNNLCFIAHTDCEADALYVKSKVEELLGEGKEFLIQQAGPVLGAHTGPGAVALCMLADHR